MEKLKSFTHYINKYTLNLLCLFSACLKSYLCKLNIPIAEDIPDEVIELLYCNTKLKLIKVVCNFLSESVVL